MSRRKQEINETVEAVQRANARVQRLLQTDVELIQINPSPREVPNRTVLAVLTTLAFVLCLVFLAYLIYINAPYL